MSSINPHFTVQYSQPEEYHFSHDSVFLARKVFELLRQEDLSQLRGLDLCAGCGIIGLDFLFHCFHEEEKQLRSFDFVEVQSIYHNHFQKNLQNFSFLQMPLHFQNINYEELLHNQYAECFDLILCNPPYFHPGQGKLSPSQFKNRCRFFIDSDFQKLLSAVENSLAPLGRAFMLFRNTKDHGYDYLPLMQKFLSTKMQIEKIGEVRGTDLILISKSS